MLLVFDVGNSNIVLGMFREEKLTYSWRISTDQAKSSDEYVILINQLYDIMT